MEVFSTLVVTVNVASSRHLLAMKVRAARGERDLSGIVVLPEVLGVTALAAVLAIADEVWGLGVIRDDCVCLVRQGLLDAGSAEWEARCTRPHSRR